MVAQLDKDVVKKSSVGEIADAIDGMDDELAAHAFDVLSDQINQAIAQKDSNKKIVVDHLSSILIYMKSNVRTPERVALLIECCRYYWTIGHSYLGIACG